MISITHQNGNAITSASNIANVNPIRYRGYYYDAEIGMYYLQSRYYDSQIGRFINADDSAFLGASGTVLSYNLFAYCENNPVNYFDSIGCTKYRIGKKDIVVDKYGLKILKHYLTGKGKTLSINDNDWKNYLLKSKMCGCSNYSKYDSTLTLKQYIGKYIIKNKDNMPKKIFEKASFKIAAAITNGEGIVGRNYLHGTNATAGGLKLIVILVKIDNKQYYKVDATWNDYIDPNFAYDSDSRKYAIAKKLPLCNPTKYKIRISWTDYYLALN